MADEKKEERKGRPYQVDLVEYALRENTIVNLGTGAGKTFVAVMLIREMCNQTVGPFTAEGGQRTIFLAHTVPLVKQQAEYIRQNTNLTVSDFCGDSKGIDNWPKEIWYEHFNGNNVLVFSRAIFLDLLLKGFIKPRQVNLLVFDECHHATKNDPFVQIMKVIKDSPEDERPRILGLSASLLGQKVKPGELEKGIKGLESILMSRSRTAPDISEVVKYATNPEEKILSFDSNLDRVGKKLKQILSPPLKFIQMKVNKRRGKFPIEEAATSVLTDLYEILVDLGPASAAEFVSQSISELRKAMKNEPIDKWEEMIGYLVLSHLTTFNSKCIDFKEKEQLQHSNKVCTLLSEIALNKEKLSQDSDIRGIIFTEKRHTASCLAKLIQDKSESVESTTPSLKEIKCDFVVGHNIGQTATAMRKEARMKSKEQDKVLSKFRKGKINLLIATSVIEEGVDVPRCNLVIRFDLPQNFRSYVQSKGRARDKPSTFVLLVGDNQVYNDVNDYHILEEELISICQSNRELPTEDEIQQKMADKVPPYMPNGRDGPRVTVGNSLTLLHRYCQKLPHDDYTIMAPNFKVFKVPKSSSIRTICTEEEDEDPNHDYICHLTLPSNCPIKNVIESPPLGSKLQSHRAAALFAMEELHKLKEVDNLFKSTPSFDSDDEEVKQEKLIPLAGTEKRTQIYINKVPKVLTGSHQLSDTFNYLYVFVIRNEKTGKLFNRSEMFGILLHNPLKHWKIPQYSLYKKSYTQDEDEIELTVKLESYPLKSHLTPEELSIYRECHHNIFSKIICIQPNELLPDFDKADKCYIVVPVAITSPNESKIDEVSIDLEKATTIVSQISQKRSPHPTEKLDNALVSAAHRDPTTHTGLLELFHVKMDPSITPLSPFPDPDRYPNFLEYYKSKYKYELSDPNQPGLICSRVSMSHLKYFTKRFTQVPHANKKNSIIIFPEAVHLYPVPASFWMLLRFLPAVLWRFESLLLADELSTTVTSDINIGRLSCDTELITNTAVKGYVDAGFGNLPSQILKVSQDTVPEIIYLTDTPDNIDLRGPDNCLILQALTPRAANDSINLERLELLGDSLLKLVTSVYLYNNRSHHHEGKLSEARSRRVSNINLYCLGKKNSIDTKILSNDFNMGADSSNGFNRLRWIPPGYVLSTQSQQLEERYKSHTATDKCVADCVEALIGAYTVAGGLNGGLSFIKWLGIKLELAHNVSDVQSNVPPSKSDNLLFSNSSLVFKKYLGVPVLPSLKPTQVNDRDRMLSQIGKLEKTISYKFYNQLLLIEAMTHTSYSRNPITHCYQRLEFLGDAVLDYLVTCQIYSSDSLSTPGHMTDLRSAIVCNTQFAELAVSLNLHKILLQHSPLLFKKIGKYVTALKERNDDKFKLKFEELSISDKQQISSDGGCYDDDDDDEEEDLLDPPKCLSDSFEALAGAVFIDSSMNLQLVWDTFGPFLQPLLDKFNSNLPTNPIKDLYEKLPTRVSIKKVLQDYGYLCTIKIEGTEIQESAIAISYKNAKNAAATKVLQKLVKNDLI